MASKYQVQLSVLPQISFPVRHLVNTEGCLIATAAFTGKVRRELFKLLAEQRNPSIVDPDNGNPPYLPSFDMTVVDRSGGSSVHYSGCQVLDSSYNTTTEMVVAYAKKTERWGEPDIEVDSRTYAGG